MKNNKKGCGCFGLIALILLIFIGVGIALPNSNNDTKEASTPTTQATQVAEATTAPTEEVTTEEATTEATVATTEAVPIGKQNALAKAYDYLAYTAFSKKGLKEQLEY